MHWRTLAIRICLLMGLTLATYLATRRAIGAWCFDQGSPDAIQTAIKWDPANPEYYDALGTLTHLYGAGANSNEIVQLYESATRLSPHDAQFWADLGAGYDWAGRTGDAFDAFQRASLLFPNSPDINWRLANFYIRAGRNLEGMSALRVVLVGDGAARRRVFTLAENATRDREAILQMLPLRADIFFDYLNFLVERGDIAGAEEVWARVLRLNLPFDFREAFPYLDALIQHKEVDRLTDAWSALAARFPGQVPNSVRTPNLITNGSFESDIVNGGLDWRVIPLEGVIVRVDSAAALAGSRALQIKFDGAHNLDYRHLFQFVPVQPNTQYRFSGHMRVQGITTDSGPRFQICDAYNLAEPFVSTENLVGTSGWSDQKTQFTTKVDTHLLIVRVARPLSSKFDNKIGGTVWISSVSLKPE